MTPGNLSARLIASALLWGGATAVAQDLPGVTPSATENQDVIADYGSLPGDQRLTLSAGVGSASYEEEIRIEPVNSEFDAVTLSLGGEWEYAHPTGYRVALSVEYWATEDDTETWRAGGDVVQRNDLEVDELSLAGHWGWDFVREEDRRITGWIGLAWRGTSFARSDFVVLGEGVAEDLGTVDEDYTILFIDGRLDGEQPLGDQVSLRAGVSVGGVFFNEADNDLLGTIEGSGGVVIGGEVGVHWALSETQSLGLTVKADHQSLDGDQVEQLFLTPEGLLVAAVEWPDNELVRWQAGLAWTIKL